MHKFIMLSLMECNSRIRGVCGLLLDGWWSRSAQENGGGCIGLC